jgi:2-dehydro-3-deoxyphosphogluconate aldolase/(4S)-4-hydroxy-2-oxoglutarate aldolase
MQRAAYLQKVLNAGVVAVVRTKTPQQAIDVVDALVQGGVKAIELTYSVPRANDVIAELVAKYEGTDVVIGAGTVLDPTSARLAILAGAQFIVSPSFSEEVAKMSNLYQIPYSPGVMTPTEAQRAMEYGSELIKLFPGDVTGPAMIKDLKGPFPYINILPSGGVSIDNIPQWLQAGASLVSAGSNLTAPALQGDYARTTENAKAFMKAYEDAKG